MSPIRSRWLRPLIHAALVSSCVALPACVEDIIVPPPPPSDDPDDGVVQPPDNRQAVFYDVSTFAQRIQPLLDAGSCATAGCHSQQARAGTFALWNRPEPGSVEMWSNLQYVASLVDLAVPSFQAEESAFYVRATDRHLSSMFTDPPALAAWLEDAAARFQGGEPGEPDYFDAAVFETQVQPILDEAGCSNPGCHHRTSGLAFALYPMPALESAEMAANRQAVIEWIELDAPGVEETTFYVRAVDGHRGAALPDPQAQLIADWIQRGLDAAAAE
jgi:hypothetical protein